MIIKHECNSIEKIDYLQKIFDVTAIIQETKSAPFSERIIAHSNLTNINAVQEIRNSRLDFIKSPWSWCFVDVVSNATPQPEIIYR